MQRDFKGVWIPKWIWINKELSVMEKLFLVEIDSLDNSEGCYASNEHFSNFFGISKTRCSTIIRDLEKKGFVNIFHQYKNGTKSIEKRIVRCTKKLYGENEKGCVENRTGCVENGTECVENGTGCVENGTGCVENGTGCVENLKDNNTVSNTVNNTVSMLVVETEEKNKQTDEQRIISELKNLNIAATQFVLNTVRMWLRQYDVQLLELVINKCILTSTRGVNLNYLKTTIENLEKKGIKTCEDFERSEKQRKTSYTSSNTRNETMPNWDQQTKEHNDWINSLSPEEYAQKLADVEELMRDLN